MLKEKGFVLIRPSRWFVVQRPKVVHIFKDDTIYLKIKIESLNACSISSQKNSKWTTGKNWGLHFC